MVKKLRRKFVAVAMCSVIAVLAIIIGIINSVSFYDVTSSADRLISILEENNGKFPKPEKEKDGKTWRAPYGKNGVSPDTPYKTRHFSVLFDESGDVIDVNTESTLLTDSQAIEYANAVCSSGKNSGFYSSFRYSVSDSSQGKLVIFLDCYQDLSTLYSFFGASIWVSLAGIAGVLILVLVFSKIVIRPIAESLEKQKQFITGASHEIKTPLAIIDANLSVLEMKDGESDWTKSIHKQVSRLSQLTSNLVALARMDEENIRLKLTDFSLSDAVEETLTPFLPIAEARRKTFSLEIQPNLSYHGDEQAIRQLISILADNAMKYSDRHGIIQVALEKTGRNFELTFFNTVEHLASADNLDRLFERFYRGDASRSSEIEGYGVGLSLAKAIVLSHKGKIFAKSTDGRSLTITVIL